MELMISVVMAAIVSSSTILSGSIGMSFISTRASVNEAMLREQGRLDNAAKNSYKTRYPKTGLGSI